MRRLVAILLLLLLSGPVMAAKKLLVGTTGDYKPVTWFEPSTGQYRGEDIDLIKAFAAANGYDITFVRTTWPGMMKDLHAGKFQVAVGGISRTAERAELALLSNAIALTGKVALVRCDETGKFTSLDAIDQAGTRVVENRGGTNQQFALSKIDKATIIIVPNNAKPFDYLENGKADAMFTDSIEAIYRQKQGEGLCAVSPDKPYTRVEKVFMFRTDEAGLRDAFNRWLAARQVPAANAAR